jgi:hypothetical protein
VFKQLVLGHLSSSEQVLQQEYGMAQERDED